MNSQFTRETCFEPSTSVLVIGGSRTQYGGRAGEEESSNVSYSKEDIDAADCNCLWKEDSSAHEKSGSDWTISFRALQDSGPSAKALMLSMSCSSLHVQLEDEHYMKPISCTDANTPRIFAAHYSTSVQETDPNSSGVILLSLKSIDQL